MPQLGKQHPGLFYMGARLLPLCREDSDVTSESQGQGHSPTPGPAEREVWSWDVSGFLSALLLSTAFCALEEHLLCNDFKPVLPGLLDLSIS